MKNLYIFYLLTSFTSANLIAQTTFDWENAIHNGTTVDQTINTITATFTVSSGNPFLADGDGYGGTSGFLVGSGSNNTDSSATITFSSPVNIQSLFAVNAYFANPPANWTFIPTGGDNSNVIVNVPNSNSNGVTVTLNWADITEITVTSSSGVDGFAFDDLLTVSELDNQEFVNFNKKIMIYPNPSVDYIKVSGLNKAWKYSILNSLGQNIRNGIISDNNTVDIQNLISGLYFLKFENGKTIKFLKR